VINDAFPAAPARPNKVRTYLDPEVRHALDRLVEEKSWGTMSAAVREAALLGMEALGWDARRIRTEYLKYSLGCAERGEVNKYDPDR
jgi:hypothetical protein